MLSVKKEIREDTISEHFIRHKCHKNKTRAVTNKEWNCALSHRQNIFSRCQAFGLRAIRRLVLQPNGVHSPLSERKRNATQDRWMTDESFPFMRFRMLTLICCHVSPWLKSVCVYELVWKTKERTKEKRAWVYFSLLHYSSGHQIFHWIIPPCPYLSSRCHCSFTYMLLCLNHGRCFSRN